MKTLQQDWKALKKYLSNRKFSDFESFQTGYEIIPDQCDILIIGGGAIGSAIAYWLKETVHKEEFRVVVVEKDPSVRY